MQLYVSHTSPYGRLCLIRAYLLGRHDMQLIFTDPWQNPPELAAQNPFSQLPVLITDAGEAIYNSLLICQYLEPQAPTEAGFGAIGFSPSEANLSRKSLNFWPPLSSGCCAFRKV